MLNFIKYEIKGTYKYIAGAVALVLVLIGALFGTIFYLSKNHGDSTSFGLFLIITIFVLFGTAITTVFYIIVGSFRKELYEDRGYLTFTLPLTGKQIVASKVIAALLWLTVMGIIIVGFITALFLILAPQTEYGIREIFSQFYAAIMDEIGIRGSIFGFIVYNFSTISMLLLIYFSMAIGKITIKNKKIDGLWFLIYILLVFLIGFIQYKIMELVPYYFNIQNMNIETVEDIFKNAITNEISVKYNNGLDISGQFGFLRVNIASAIYNILVTLGLFVGTGYLIDKKIDL